jgi:hypothetical protein
MIFRFGFPHIYSMSGDQYPLTAICAHCGEKRELDVSVDIAKANVKGNMIERISPGWYRVRPESVCPGHFADGVQGFPEGK